MSILKSITRHVIAANNRNSYNIVKTVHQYQVTHNSKYIGTVTFCPDSLVTTMMMISRLNHYKIDRRVTVKHYWEYEFYGVDQYDKPIKLVATRLY